jgi:hypothetical protein
MDAKQPQIVLHRIDEDESAEAHSTVFPGATGGLHEVFVSVCLEEPLRVWVRESVLLDVVGVHLAPLFFLLLLSGAGFSYS